MENNNRRGGIGFVGLLQIAFIVLKLLNVIRWGWLWVLSPTWIYVIAMVAIVAIGMLASRKWEDRK